MLPMWYRLSASLHEYFKIKFPELECQLTPETAPPEKGFVIAFDLEEERNIYSNLANGPSGYTRLFLECWESPDIRNGESEIIKSIALLQAKAEQALMEWANELPNGDLKGSFVLEIPQIISDAGANRPAIAVRIVLYIKWNQHGCI